MRQKATYLSSFLFYKSLSHLVRVVDVNGDKIIIDDPYGTIQAFKDRKDNRNSGGYKGGKNDRYNFILKVESNLWSWEQLKNDNIKLL